MKDNPKHTDHHFTKMSDYKYTLEFVEPRKSDLEILYNELKERKKYLDSAVILEDYNIFAVNGMKKENKLILDRIKEMLK